MASIEKRGENSYRLTVSCGYNKQGKKIRKYKTIDLSHIKPNKQLDEANKQWILFNDEIEKGLYLDSGKITFEEFIEKWLKDYAEHGLAPKTLFSYKELLNSRIIPALGHIKLNRLQPTHLTEFYNNLREDGMRRDKKYIIKPNFFNIISESELTLSEVLKKANVAKGTLSNLKNHKHISQSVSTRISEAAGLNILELFDQVGKTGNLSERTILYHHRLISSILTCAMQWGFILNNPASRVKAPKIEKKEARHFDAYQVEYIFQLINKEPLKYKTMVYLSIFSGMRAGELNGLEWSDIDCDKNTIRIHQASQYLPHKGIYTKSTKNESSIRVIALPDTVMSLLRQYKLWQNGERAKLDNLWVNSNRLFTKLNGDPIFPHTLGKWFTRFIKKHNDNVMKDNSIPKEEKENYLLDTVNFHGLRHTNATLLIALGTDVTTVAGRLGHKETSTTMNIYSHFLQKSDRSAADKLENLFKNDINKKKQG